MPAGSSPRRKRGRGRRVLVGSADHTTNSGSTSAVRKRGMGGRAAGAHPLVTVICPPLSWKVSPRPRGAAVVATGCLRGRPRPRLGGGEARPTWQAFPFSAAENHLDGAMKKKEKQAEINWKGALRSVLIAGEGQPLAPTIAGNHDPFFCMQGLIQSVQLPRRRGEVETSTSNQPPRGSQGRRLLGPAALRSCPFASLHGQVRARLGPGGYCRCSGNEGPQTYLPAAYGLWHGSRRGPARPIFINTDPRPSRGAKPRGADDTELPQARPHQAGSRGGGEIKAGYLMRCPRRKP